MSSMAVSCIVFGAVFGGAILGMILRVRLPQDHLIQDSKDVVKVGMGLIGTLTALVLGLLIASAKSSFDGQRNGLAQLAGNVSFLDRPRALRTRVKGGPGSAQELGHRYAQSNLARR